MEDRRPFRGIKVLDVTRVLASPFATYQLALLGADVLKIEDPESGGDSLRYRRGSDPAYGAQGMATLFLSQGANKRSMLLNLRKPEGQAIFQELARESDVVVENLRAGTMAKYGLGYEALAELNPRLVYCSLTGYGQTGPKRRHPAYDPVIQAASGMMSLTGTPETGPLKAGAQVVDYGAGLAAAFGLATALFERERSGKGQLVDVSMLDTALVMMSSFVTDVLTTAARPKPWGNQSSPETFGNATFRCACGGLIAIAAIEPHHVARLWASMGRSDLARDPRFATKEACSANIQALHEEMARTFLARPAQDWEELLNEADVPAMRVRTVAEALEMPQVAARDLVRRIAPVEGTPGGAAVALTPFRLSAGGPEVESPPARVGAHTEEVLRRLGRSPQDIASLKEKGVI